MLHLWSYENKDEEEMNDSDSNSYNPYRRERSPTPPSISSQEEKRRSLNKDGMGGSGSGSERETRAGSGIIRAINGGDLGMPFRSELKSEVAFNPSIIEAVSLILLCSPFASIRCVRVCSLLNNNPCGFSQKSYCRALAIEIITAVRLIATSLLQQKQAEQAMARERGDITDDLDDMSEADVPPARVMDVFEEIGSDAINQFHHDFHIHRLLVLLKQFKNLFF